jgi:hypothetical protein
VSVKTMECTAVLPSGEMCGEIAVVHSAQHEYDTQLYEGEGGYQYRLRRSHFEIECPRCGFRTQTVEAEGA